MEEKKRILGLIPARGGSKGLPGKNIKSLLGKPLIAWTIEQAQKSTCFDRIFVTTDSEEIAEVSRRYGVEVPFLRPTALAADESPTADAVIHVLEEWKERGERFDYIALLEPTSPLRRDRDIDRSIRLLLENPAVDSLISVGEVHMEHPLIVKKISENGFVTPYLQDGAPIHQRQQADKAYFPYGVLYICRTEVYKRERTFYTKKTIPFYIERWQNYEVDDALDFLIVETIMKLPKEVRDG